MNKVVLIGRLTRDPELRFTPGNGTAVATFTLAVDRRFSKNGEADFIPIVVWGKPAENLANYMSKGKLIGVSGRIQTRNYEAKDGHRVYVTEVVADEVQYLERGNGVGRQTQGNGEPALNNTNDNFMESYDNEITPMDDSDIPF